ncbi:MAG: diguanylate cyclase [Candidatus Abyssobacteria bacterium SURF_17]|uniref:diguanylate cyclase n=1 Tax=Candidatus Abyssobacteria bacterium SURF_17 TaxID=2093361 RepID=A0A419F9A4_9BACT|nr:MAG: diguanylate cyclase [Candidatus Abyssubacteria bacterium SURF_17]
MDIVILTATNNQKFRDVLDSVLRDSYKVLHASSIGEAFDALRIYPIDIAIVDEIVDGRSAHEFLTDIYKIGKYVTVLVMTENVTAESISRSLAQGAYDLISKPIVEREVLFRVGRAARNARLIRELQVKGDLEEAPYASAARRVEARANAMPLLEVQSLTYHVSHTSESLKKLAEAVVNIRDTKTLYKMLIEAVAGFFTVNQCALVIMEQDGVTLSVQASRGLDDEFLSETRFHASEGIFSWLWRNGRILYTEAIGKEATLEDLETIRREAKILHAKLCVPIGLKRKPLGYLALGSKFTGDDYRKDELEFAFAMGSYAAAAIENALLLEKTKQLATTDELTKLHNRRSCMQWLQDEIDRSKRYGRSLSVVIFDIDHFKGINDTLGHSAGDEVLKGASRFLLRCSRHTDVLGRWGGEEFIAILPETAEEVAQAYCERVRRGVEERLGRKESAEFLHLGLTISGGVTTLDHENDTLDTLIERADQALYCAKRKGRNRCEKL